MSSNTDGDRRGGGQAGGGEETIDARRYLDVVWRGRKLIAAIVVAVTVLVLVLSLVLPKSYESTARVVVDNSGLALGTADAQTIQRELATTESLVMTSTVLADAARRIPGETRSSIEPRVKAAVDQQANIINITVTADTAEGAARLASAVAAAFIAQQERVQRARIERAQAALTDQITQLRTEPSTNPDVASELRALQDRAAELSVAAASAGSELQLVQPPQVPEAAASPKPLRNGVIAFFAALFLGILIVLGLDQLRPRIGSQRELSHLLGLPVLSGIPYVTRRVNARNARAEYETYQTLSAAVRLALPPSADGPHILLVTSAAHGEGKTTVTARLARLLAQAGHSTLVISGDLRSPKIDELFDAGGRTGLQDLLAGVPTNGSMALNDVTARISSVRDEGTVNRRARLDLLAAGRTTQDTSSLLATTALESLFEMLRRLGYTYILVDSPPLLGIADSQMLARFCDELLLVTRLDRMTSSSVLDLRELLDRLGRDPIGLVVLGARIAESPYYSAEGFEPTPARA